MKKKKSLVLILLAAAFLVCLLTNIISQVQAPPIPIFINSVTINDGDATTYSLDVTLTLTTGLIIIPGPSIEDMRFNNYDPSIGFNALLYSPWEPWAKTKDWTLAGPVGDFGTRTVWCQYRFSDGTTTTAFSDDIDYTFPIIIFVNSVTINDGDATTKSSHVTLDFTTQLVILPNTITGMKVTNYPLIWPLLWEPYSSTKEWQLPSGTGTKTVYAQYRFNDGSTTTVFSDDIEVVTTPPSGTVAINSGDQYTKSKDVTLTLSATDDSNVEDMRFSNDGSTWSGWESYTTSKSWTLTDGDGTKTVYVQFRDDAGLSSSTASDTIVLDTIKPTGSIVINGGASTTTSTTVSLSLTYNDATSGVDKVRYTNNDVWGSEPWEAPTASKSWTLTSGESQKYVSYQIRDKAGWISDTYWDSIHLSVNDPPNVGSISGPTSGYRDVEYSWSASATDPDGDSLTYHWYVDGTQQSSSEGFDFTFDSSYALGAHTIKVRVEDPDGAYDEETLTFTLTEEPNNPPTISEITGPSSAYEGDTCTWTATASDPDAGDTTTITWYIDGVAKDTGDSFAYTFETETAGDYTIDARAQDNNGAFSDNATLAFTLMEEAGPPFYCYFNVPYEEETYVVETCSNSTVTDLIFNEDLLRIQFNVDGDSGESGYCNVTIPTELLSGDFTVFMDNDQLVENDDYNVASNSTHSTLGINYEHGAQVIDVIEVFGIPDFASWLLLPFVMSATILTLAFRKRLKKHRNLF